MQKNTKDNGKKETCHKDNTLTLKFFVDEKTRKVTGEVHNHGFSSKEVCETLANVVVDMELEQGLMREIMSIKMANAFKDRYDEPKSKKKATKKKSPVDNSKKSKK